MNHIPRGEYQSLPKSQCGLFGSKAVMLYGTALTMILMGCNKHKEAPEAVKDIGHNELVDTPKNDEDERDLTEHEKIDATVEFYIKRREQEGAIDPVEYQLRRLREEGGEKSGEDKDPDSK